MPAAIERAPFDRVDPARITPEHFQLLSDARLHALAGDEDGPPSYAVPGEDLPVWRRLARRELNRRHATPHAHA
jgi:hypothetical protein